MKIKKQELKRSGYTVEVKTEIELAVSEIPDDLYWDIYDTVIDNLFIFINGNGLSISSGDSDRWKSIKWEDLLYGEVKDCHASIKDIRLLRSKFVSVIKKINDSIKSREDIEKDYQERIRQSHARKDMK